MSTHPDFVDLIVAQLVAELPEAGAEAIAPIARFGRLDSRLRKSVITRIGLHGLREAEYNVLAALRRSGAPYQLAPSDVSRSMLFTSGGLTPVLDRLEQRGLVKRQPDAEDRRKLRIQLTPAGMALHAEALDSYVEIATKVTSVLTRDQKEQLNGLLRILLLSLDDLGAE
ncbi:MAG: MarR family transcriptional regulator [Terrimesophilobacter sp.]